MLRVTFYSYKGGVGRTLALVNVAAILARSGRRVVAVDLDLEAPGFGLSEATERRAGTLGASDFILSRQERRDIAIEDCVYSPKDEDLAGHLSLMPAGTRTGELTERLPGFYAQPDSDDAYLFQWLTASIEDAFKPDYLLFDSRTGRADVAGVCTAELPDVMVAVCGLNQQNVSGMLEVLGDLADHPARVDPVATILALSPVPRATDLELPSPREWMGEYPTWSDIERKRRSHPLLDAVVRAQERLLVPIQRWFAAARIRFPDANARDLYHELPYDPMVPLLDELALPWDADLTHAHMRLARSLTRMHGADDVLEIADVRDPQVWIRGRDQ